MKRALLLLLFSTNALAQSLTYGPIIGRGVTPDQMIVKWGTSSASDATSVSFKTGGGSSMTVTGNASKDHEVVLTGLQLSTQYDYTVTSLSTPASASFHTCPAAGAPMDVVFYGDSRDGQAEHTKIVGQVMAKSPDIVFESGDLYVTGAYSGYLSEFFPATKNLVSNTPFMAVPGNHDDPSASTLASSFGVIFPAPRAAGAAWQPYYAFTCGNTTFIGLNSNNVADAAQMTFLNGQLAAAKGDATIDHVVVWFHHSAYSPGQHGDDTSVQSTWVPLFDDPSNKVHLVFSGHDHIYARLHDSSSTMYVVSGGAGAPLYTVGGSTAATVDKQVSTYNFTLLHIAGGLITGTAYDDTGTQLDTFSTGMGGGGGGGAADMATGGGGGGGGADMAMGGGG
ncbi:MAG TPA: metallophosphoesterase, partial [Polyangia bacterium]|nr:metallophosphoesterase [Polyangia bacterium]